jgi:hypothetical protein
MIGCALCEDWFHIGCLRLSACLKHLPPPGVTVVCLVEPAHGQHIDVSGEYVCPGCSHTQWGTGASMASVAAAAAAAAEAAAADATAPADSAGSSSASATRGD